MIDLHHAVMNGDGFESWENMYDHLSLCDMCGTQMCSCAGCCFVFCSWQIWNQLSDRDAEATRRFSRVQHYFSSMLHSFGWRPFYPTLQQDVFSSMWPDPDKRAVLWTIVNKGKDISGPQLSIPVSIMAITSDSARAAPSDIVWFDIYSGLEIVPSTIDAVSGAVILSFPIEANAFRYVLQIGRTNVTADLKQLLSDMHQMTDKPLVAYSDQPVYLRQQMLVHQPVYAALPPERMAMIPGDHGWNCMFAIVIAPLFPVRSRLQSDHFTRSLSRVCVRACMRACSYCCWCGNRAIPWNMGTWFR